VRRMLESQGYQVLATDDPRQALRLAAEAPGPVALLLTDVMMPHLSGRQLHDQLHQRHPALRCVYMSGYPANVLDQAGGLDPRHPYLQKPFTLEELHEKVRLALGA